MGGFPTVNLTNEGVTKWLKLLELNGFDVKSFTETRQAAFILLERESILVTVIQDVNSETGENTLIFRATNSEQQRAIKSAVELLNDGKLLISYNGFD